MSCRLASPVIPRIRVEQGYLTALDSDTLMMASALVYSGATRRFLSVLWTTAQGG